MDYVVTVCNNANNEVCPIWPEKNQIIHWDIEDPVSKLLNSNENEKNILINNTFNQINKNIIDWISNEK
jgi:protein-tyrosine-phosphatase